MSTLPLARRWFSRSLLLLPLVVCTDLPCPSLVAAAPPQDVAGLPAPPVAPEVVARDAEGHVTVRAVRVPEPIDVDGNLREHLYETVLPISDFIQNVPDVGQPASQKTDAWVMFDDDNLYVSARCWDTAPESEWVANEMRRDGSGITNNDNFGVTFDTFHDRRNGFMFYINPIGGMNDTQITNESGANRDWNTVWRARTGRFEGGWTVEMQIPFKSLRYRPGASQTWGIQFRRGIRRRNEWTFLTAVPPEDGSGGWIRISRFATLVGLEVPAGSKNLEIKPYAISDLTTDRTVSPTITNEVSGEAGLDAKYGVTQNLTLDFTYNTDFAQVEVDEQQINLTRFNLFYPEKREFFLESRGLFEFGHGGRGGSGGGGNLPELFFSRQIGLNRGRVVPIIVGGRLTGKVNRTSIGALNIETDDEQVSGTPKTNFTTLRLKQDLLRRSYIGVMFTGRSRSTLSPDVSNQAYGADAAFSFYENVHFNGYYARTETPGLTGKKDSYQARFNYAADRYGLDIDHLVVGEHFRPDVGFVRRSDMRRTFVLGRFSPRMRSSRLVRRLLWDASLEYIEDVAGRLETRTQSASFDTEFQNSDRINMEVTRSYELLVQPFRVDRVTIPAGEYHFNRMNAAYTLGQQRRLSGTFSVSVGGFYDGDQTSVALSSGRLEITPQLTLEPTLSVNWVDLPDGSFTAQLYRSRVTYGFTPRMFVAGLLQYNSSTNTMSTNLRLRWEYVPGSELFVVYTDDQDTNVAGEGFSTLLNRALVVKVNRLLRF
jgi:hypothetical protein